MHTDLAWQRTIDRQSYLQRQARSWRLSGRRSTIDPPIDGQSALDSRTSELGVVRGAE
jgi:hypothetical protein